MDTFDSRLNASVRQHAHRLDQLTRILAGELTFDCSGHFHVANERERQVVIMADSPVWAARLRQLSPQIIAILQQHGNHRLLHVRVFSRPGNQQTVIGRLPARTEHVRYISPKSQQLITQAAACIENDGLRTALLKLAAHASATKKKRK